MRSGPTDAQPVGAARAVATALPCSFELSTAVGSPTECLRLVPYVVEIRWLLLLAAPQTGKIVMDWQEGQRKILADQACCLVRSRGLTFVCRVIGPLLDGHAPPELEGLTDLRAVPHSQVHQEFSRAGVAVLPLLSWGMALATLQAMACDIPVAATATAAAGRSPSAAPRRPDSVQTVGCTTTSPSWQLCSCQDAGGVFAPRSAP